MGHAFTAMLIVFIVVAFLFVIERIYVMIMRRKRGTRYEHRHRLDRTSFENEVMECSL